MSTEELRDHFAGLAMQAIISKLPLVDQSGEFGKPVEDKIAHNLAIAESAYWIADAMLEAREFILTPNPCAEVIASQQAEIDRLKWNYWLGWRAALIGAIIGSCLSYFL